MGLIFEWDEKKAIGKSKQFNTLVVVHIERGEAIRIISARKATRKEQKYYEEY